MTTQYRLRILLMAFGASTKLLHVDPGWHCMGDRLRKGKTIRYV